MDHHKIKITIKIGHCFSRNRKYILTTIGNANLEKKVLREVQAVKVEMQSGDSELFSLFRARRTLRVRLETQRSSLLCDFSRFQGSTNAVYAARHE